MLHTLTMDISILLQYLKSTSNLALSCKGFAWRVRSNGFPIRTSEGALCLENLSYYNALNYPKTDKWLTEQVFEAMDIDNDDPEMLQLLLENGADPNSIISEYHGDTPLTWAAGWGQTECVKILLEGKAGLEAKNYDGDTAISEAAMNGETDCIRLLLDHKANLEVINNGGDTPLMGAVRFGKAECVQLLLENKADPEANDDVGYTSLEIAAARG